MVVDEDFIETVEMLIKAFMESGQCIYISTCYSLLEDIEKLREVDDYSFKF